MGCVFGVCIRLFPCCAPDIPPTHYLKDIEADLNTGELTRRTAKTALSAPIAQPPCSSKQQQQQEPRNTFHQHTGDLVLMRFRRKCQCCLEFAAGSEWFHAGFIIKDTSKKRTLLDICHSVVPNVTRQPLNRVVTDNMGFYREMCIRRLVQPLTQEQQQAVVDFEYDHRVVKQTPYEKVYSSLVYARLDCCDGYYNCCGRKCGGCTRNVEDESSMFCSEYVAAMYKHIGLLDVDIPSNEYLPVDFAPSSSETNLFSESYYVNLGSYLAPQPPDNPTDLLSPPSSPVPMDKRSLKIMDLRGRNTAHRQDQNWRKRERRKSAVNCSDLTLAVLSGLSHGAGELNNNLAGKNSELAGAAGELPESLV